MNVILHYVDHTNLIDGNTLTVLDLFFFLQKKVKMKCVFFIDCDINLNFLYNLIKSRYNLDNISTKKSIMFQQRHMNLLLECWWKVST